MGGFRLSPEAESNLDQIRICAANRLIDSIAHRFWLLGQHPEIGRRRDYDLRPGLRSFPPGVYVIVYRIERADVLILHVMHGSRDVAGLLGN